MSHWTDPRAFLLRHAFLYNGFQTLVGGRRARRLFIERIVRPSPGLKILDIGCGPGDILDFLPLVDYHGVDVDPDYIGAAESRYGDRGTFRCAGVDDLTAEGLTTAERGTFDLVLALGVVHHLDDEQACGLFELAAGALRPGGRLFTLDGCFAPRQNPLARLLLKSDRGEYVREQAAYEDLARATFDDVRSRIDERLFHVPYTILIMECRQG